MLRQLVAVASRHRDAITQVLGVDLAERPTVLLRQLLRLVGHRLTVERRRQGLGRNAPAVYRYKVEREALPNGVDLEAMQTAWATYLGARPETEAPEPWFSFCRALKAKGLPLPGFFGRLFRERYA
jgi:hypothetical protein